MQQALEVLAPLITVVIFGALILAIVAWYALIKIRLIQSVRQAAFANTAAAQKSISAVASMVAELSINSSRYFDMPEDIKKELYEAHQASMQLERRK